MNILNLSLIVLFLMINAGCANNPGASNDFIKLNKINNNIPTGSIVDKSVKLNGIDLPMSDGSWQLLQSSISKPETTIDNSNGTLAAVVLGQYKDFHLNTSYLFAQVAIEKEKIKFLPSDQCRLENPIWLNVEQKSNEIKCTVGFVQLVPMGGYSTPYLTVRVVVAKESEKWYQVDLSVNLTALGYVRFDAGDWSFKAVQRDFLKQEVRRRLQIWSSKLLDGASQATFKSTTHPFGTLPSLWDEMLAAHKAVYP